MPAPLDLHKATVESVRWYILRALDAGRPMPVNEDILLRTLDGADFPITIHELRRELDYLGLRKLVEMKGKDDDFWEASLTQLGIDVVEYTIECKPGIARPPKRG